MNKPDSFLLSVLHLGTWALILLLSLAACAPTETRPSAPRAEQGVLDLRGWDLPQAGSVRLDGEWAFYWNALLNPDEVASSVPDAYVPVPANWSAYNLHNQDLPPTGYATYHLKFYPPEVGQTYGLYFHSQGTASALWLNGVQLVKDGVVGPTAEAMRPSFTPVVVFFQAQQSPLDLVMQVSNFHHRNGGLRNEIILDTAEAIHALHLRLLFRDIVLFAVLFIIGLYHLFLYLFRPKDISPL
jgi:hypothetical protein